MSHLAVIFAREIPVQTRCPDQYLRERSAAGLIDLRQSRPCCWIEQRSGVVDDVAMTPASPGVGGVPRPLDLTDARDETEQWVCRGR